MKKVLISLLIFALLFILILMAFSILGIQSRPLVRPGKKLDFEDVARVKQWMHENNPRRLRPGDTKTALLTERDLNLFLDYGLSQAPGNQQLYAQVNLLQNSAEMRFTYVLPNNPIGDYLNITTDLAPETSQIMVRKLKIGAIFIPGWLVNFGAGLAHRILMRFEVYQDVIDLAHSVKDIQINEGRVAVVYQWQPEKIKKLQVQGGRFILPEDDRKRLIAYDKRLTAISRTLDGREVSITNCLGPLFQFATQQTLNSGNPEAENRALILTLAAFSVGRSMERFFGETNAQTTQRKGRVELTLLGRDDLAKHFLVSAAISVSAGSGLANLAGIFKEMDDSRGGSGFSFADLAADRAGVRFAEIACGAAQQAKFLQQSMYGVSTESDYMPRVDNLPEGIQELEFKRKYKDLDSATYRMVENEIERRISACRLYQAKSFYQ